MKISVRPKLCYNCILHLFTNNVEEKYLFFADLKTSFSSGVMNGCPVVFVQAVNQILATVLEIDICCVFKSAFTFKTQITILLRMKIRASVPHQFQC